MSRRGKAKRTKDRLYTYPYNVSNSTMYKINGLKIRYQILQTYKFKLNLTISFLVP